MNFQPVRDDSGTLSVFQEKEKGFFLLLLNILRSFKLKSNVFVLKLKNARELYRLFHVNIQKLCNEIIVTIMNESYVSISCW